MPPKRGSEFTHSGCDGSRAPPDAAIGVSYRDATGMTLMTETVTIDRPSVAKPASRRRSAKPATVSASALALHLDCSRTYIGKLEAEGVIQRQGDGFPLDQSRVAYLRTCGASDSNRRAVRRTPSRQGQDRTAATEADGEEARTGAPGRCQ